MIRTCFAVLMMSVLWLPHAYAQGFTVSVQGAQELTLGLPAVATPSGPGRLDPGVLFDTVHKDLDMTGWFNILPAEAAVDTSEGVEPGSFDMSTWTLVGAAGLAKMRLLPPGDPACDPGGDRFCADVYIYDVAGNQKIAGRRFRAEPEHLRSVGHKVSSAILMALVGDPGFFTGRIVAVGTRSGNKELYTMDHDGSNVRSVTRNGSINLSPDLSLDGRRVAWTSYRRGNPDVYVKDLVSGRTLTLSARRGVNISPSWSPDGTRIALARSEGGQSDIYILDARTGREVRRVTTGGGIDVSPDWSPDGNTLVFASERSGGSQIYLVDTRGGEPRRLTTTQGFYTDPVFSPDGSRVAFVSRKGNFDVLTIGIDGTGLQRVTQDQGDNEDPTWSPNGRYLLFSSTRDGGRKLWISTANGRHQRAVTSTGGWSQPTWNQ